MKTECGNDSASGAGCYDANKNVSHVTNFICISATLVVGLVEWRYLQQCIKE
jgi:hypothetical protein